ncbi:MAG: hypothetical protein LBC76_11005 [Treponema sp.]|jgi:hypothetical protein|nr:hypothetical protein [Treponema sp.]
MKYTIIFIFAISFYFFSCGGTPESNTDKSFLPQPEKTQNEANLPYVPEKNIESLPLKELIVSEELNSIAVVIESKESEPVIDTELVTEATPIEPQFAPYVAQVPEVPTEPPVQIQTETILPEPETLPMQTQSVQSLTQSSEQTQILPSEQAQTQSLAQAQIQTQPQAQAQTQPPVQIQSQPQIQTQPQAQITKQPTVQAPLPLAPAEEKPATGLEKPPAQIDPPRFDTAKNEPVTPFQTVLVPQNEVINFSRIIHATVGQIIEIPFRGTGWIYMEEQASRKGIAYESRRDDTEGQSLIFKVEDTGTYTLKFYRRDLIRDYVLNDYVQVISEEAPVSGGRFSQPVDRGRVVAQPRWPTVLEEAEILRGGTSSRPAVETPLANSSEREAVSTQGTVPAQNSAASQGTASAQGTVPNRQTDQPQAAASSPQSASPETAAQPEVVEAPLPPDVILQRAKDAFNGGDVPSAIALLDQYGELNNSDTDELYWLYGQFYEANSPNRNILLSLDYYRRLVREYPQSDRYNSARGRIAYLERYYINIQ